MTVNDQEPVATPDPAYAAYLVRAIAADLLDEGFAAEDVATWGADNGTAHHWVKFAAAMAEIEGAR